MSEQYLWDGTGTPDPFVADLERQLSVLRVDVRALPRVEEPRRIRWIAAAALVLLAFASLAFYSMTRWLIVPLSGAPSVDGSSVAGSTRVKRGAHVSTDAASTAVLRMGRIGEVKVLPSSTATVEQTRPFEHRLRLDRGSIHARIAAPPHLFFIDTPSGEAIDLGCEYVLEVGASGAAFLRVRSGWVAFRSNGRQVFVPNGAMVRFTPARRGTPVYEDASSEFRSALHRFDFDNGGDAALKTLLAEARGRDILTLWHLLPRSTLRQRALIMRRAERLVRIPEGIDPFAVRRGDSEAIEEFGERIGIRQSTWWMSWLRAQLS